MRKQEKKYLEIKDLDVYQEWMLSAWLCHGKNRSGKEYDWFHALDPKLQKNMRNHTELLRILVHKLEEGNQSEIDAAQKNLSTFVTQLQKVQGIGYIYFVLNRELVKIGCTSKNPQTRLKTLFPSNHPDDGETVLLHFISTNERYKIEKQFHKYYTDKRISGEWFKLTEEDIEDIKQIDEI